MIENLVTQSDIVLDFIYQHLQPFQYIFTHQLSGYKQKQFSRQVSKIIVCVDRYSGVFTGCVVFRDVGDISPFKVFRF